MEIADHRQPYLEKMKELEEAVRLTAFWTEETAIKVRETALNTMRVVEIVREILGDE